MHTISQRPPAFIDPSLISSGTIVRGAMLPGSQLGLLTREYNLDRHAQESLARDLRYTDFINSQIANGSDSDAVRLYLRAIEGTDYHKDILELVKAAGPVRHESRISVMIVAASHEECEGLADALRCFENQILAQSEFEVLVFLNHPQSLTTEKAERIRVSHRACDEFKVTHPEVDLRIISGELGFESITIGAIRKILADFTLQRLADKEEDFSQSKYLMLRTDADLRYSKKRWLQTFVDAVETYPEAKLYIGRHHFFRPSMARDPRMLFSEIFGEQLLFVQNLGDPENICGGPNVAFKPLDYAKVGGFNPLAKEAEDLELDSNLINLFFNEEISGSRAFVLLNNGSEIQTDARRAQEAAENGNAVYSQWLSEGSKFSHSDPHIRGVNRGKTDDFQTIITSATFRMQIENMLNQTIASCYPDLAYDQSELIRILRKTVERTFRIRTSTCMDIVSYNLAPKKRMPFRVIVENIDEAIPIFHKIRHKYLEQE